MDPPAVTIHEGQGYGIGVEEPTTRTSSSGSISNSKTPWKLYFGISTALLIAAIAVIIAIAVVYIPSKNNGTTEASAKIINSITSPPSGTPDPRLFGQWETLIPEEGGAAIERNLGLQSIHTVLLPSGKVLMVSGSSWRNRVPTKSYPQDGRPPPHEGVWNKSKDPFSYEKIDEYYSIVNYNAIYDPVSNTYFRIPHPVPVNDTENPGSFVPSDLFCVGHLHLPNGNVLFAGGTQYYSPQRTGTKATYIFNWQKELGINWTTFDWTQMPNSTGEFNPWQFSGLMHRGRWYPTLVPLLDGRFIIFSGFVGFDGPNFNNNTMYEFEINHFVEIFDSRSVIFNSTTNQWEKGWTHVIDVQKLSNSPFATRLPVAPPRGQNCSQRTPDEIPACETYRNDTFKLYPHNYLLKDGRIYLTREGDWNSLRDTHATALRRTNFTYFMEISESRENPEISFTRGPDRPNDVSASGTTVRDPNMDRILLFGGQLEVPNGGTMLPGLFDISDPRSQNVRLANQYVGSHGSRKLEIFELPNTKKPNGSWHLSDSNYLGDNRLEDRTMHYALLLPTKQILIQGGGNYDHYGPVYSPILLTPIYNGNVFSGNYTRTRMSEGVGPRLYHSGALLLPSGKILVVSGNTDRAIIDVNQSQSQSPFNGTHPKPNLARVNLDVFFFDDSSPAKGIHNVAPTENWVAEIFHPPYLFIEGARPVIKNITFTTNSSSNHSYNISTKIQGKTFYLLHSNLKYTMTLEPLQDDTNSRNETISLIKLPSVTHGWDHANRLISLNFTKVNDQEIQFDTPNSQEEAIVPAYYMLFFVNCRGQPSEALMVRFDDSISSIE